MDFIPPATAEEFNELSGIIDRIVREGCNEKVDAVLVFKCLALCQIALGALSYASEDMTVEDAIDMAVLEYGELFK